jgi:uncharacterized protein (UPF0297 family)
MKKLSLKSREESIGNRFNQLEISTPIYLAILGMSMVFNKAAIANNSPTSGADYLFITTSDWHDCQQIGREYREVYAFETASFYVNICQNGDRYFYSSEAKQEEVSSIFVPAYPLENRRGYRAINGNVSYLVLLPFSQKIAERSLTDSVSEATLTIERNDRLVLLESSLTKYCQKSDYPIAFEHSDVREHNSDRLATILPQLDTTENLLLKQNLERTYTFWQQPLNVNTSPSLSVNSRFDFYTIEGELHFLATCQ